MEFQYWDHAPRRSPWHFIPTLCSQMSSRSLLMTCHCSFDERILTVHPSVHLEELDKPGYECGKGSCPAGLDQAVRTARMRKGHVSLFMSPSWPLQTLGQHWNGYLSLSISEETDVTSIISRLVSQQAFINHYVSDNMSDMEEAALSRQSLCVCPRTLRGEIYKLLMPWSVW